MTSPSDAIAEAVWAQEASRTILNSALVADFVFEEAWKLCKQSQKDHPNAPPSVGKEAAKQAITDRLFHYLTSVDGQVSRLLKGKG